MYQSLTAAPKLWVAGDVLVGGEAIDQGLRKCIIFCKTIMKIIFNSSKRRNKNCID